MKEVVLVLMALLALPAWGKLPEPTPEQAKAAAEKKVQTDAQAKEDKEKLSDIMDTLTQRWRKKAAQEGWKTHPPTAVNASASAPTSAQTATPPVKSEKAGTAQPSADVKKPESERPK
jgi:hypothetical protein